MFVSRSYAVLSGGGHKDSQRGLANSFLASVTTKHVPRLSVGYERLG